MATNEYSLEPTHNFWFDRRHNTAAAATEAHVVLPVIDRTSSDTNTNDR